MATSLAAIRGKMGSIEFYQVKMRARELASSARAASEMEGWGDLTIEERMQRDLNKKRVREEIVPYLAQEKDRFFGSILVLVSKAETFDFEPIAEIGGKVAAAYRSVASDIGVLTIDGGELIVLDGQHRMAALRAVVQGEDDKGKAVTGQYVQDVPNDELVVVFVRTDVTTTRRIFSKINKHAKPTSSSDEIIISEDDGYAIVCRMLLTHGPMGVPVGNGRDLVNWRSQTLSSRDPEFITLTALHMTVKDILASEQIQFSEKKSVVRPSEDELSQAYEIARSWWADILEQVAPIGEIISSSDGIGPLRGDAEYKFGLLTRPAGLITFVKGLVKAADRGVDRRVVLEKAGKIDWRLMAPLWKDLLVSVNGRISARAESYELSSELIAYLISADTMPSEHRNKVEARLAARKGLIPSFEAADDLDPDEIYTLPDAL